MSDTRTVLVVSPNWLGDAVMALPAIADVRRHFAGGRLLVAARPSVSSLFTLVPGVEAVCDAQVPAIREAGASVAVLLPNSFASAWLVSRARVPERWGYARDFRRMLLTRAIARPRGPMHQGEYYQHLVRELGIPTGPLEPVLSIPPEDVTEARTVLSSHAWTGGGDLVVLAPGAAYGKAKQWIPSHVTQLITRLVRERGATCVLVGSRADASTTRAIRRDAPADCQPRIVDLAGQTRLPVLAGVISLAGVCVSNDSGAMHLAAAVGVPVVGLFGPTNEHATSPLPRAGVRSEVVTNPVWCRPCMLRECPLDHRCMTGLEPERVMAAVERGVRTTA